MKTTFVILSIVSTLLIGALYSSSAVSGLEEYVMSCSYTKDKKTSFCSDNDPNNNDVWRCDKQKNGTWKCGKIPKESGGGIPPDLSKALSIATESAVNVTKVPNDFASKEGQLLKDNNQITTEQANPETPPPCPDKGPIPPDCTMKPIIK